MHIPRIDRSYRNLKRYRQIVAVLIRYGFSEILVRVDLAYRLGFARNLFRLTKEWDDKSYAVRLRLVLEELGPTFVKLGQALSMRPFLIPRQLAEELSKLQDEVPPVEFSVIKPEIERYLGKEIGAI